MPPVNGTLAGTTRALLECLKDQRHDYRAGNHQAKHKKHGMHPKFLAGETSGSEPFEQNIEQTNQEHGVMDIGNRHKSLKASPEGLSLTLEGTRHWIAPRYLGKQQNLVTA
jgi:hypothetical protein